MPWKNDRSRPRSPAPWGKVAHESIHLILSSPGRPERIGSSSDPWGVGRGVMATNHEKLGRWPPRLWGSGSTWSFVQSGLVRRQVTAPGIREDLRGSPRSPCVAWDRKAKNRSPESNATIGKETEKETVLEIRGGRRRSPENSSGGSPLLLETGSLFLLGPNLMPYVKRHQVAALKPGHCTPMTNNSFLTFATQSS
jgi:hypothetical protein